MSLLQDSVSARLPQDKAENVRSFSRGCVNKVPAYKKTEDVSLSLSLLRNCFPRFLFPRNNLSLFYCQTRRGAQSRFFFLLVIIVVGLLFSCLSVLRGKSAPLLILCPGVIVLIKHYSGLLVENVWCFCLTSNVPWLHLVSISFSLFFRPLSHPLWVVSS